MSRRWRRESYACGSFGSRERPRESAAAPEPAPGTLKGAAPKPPFTDFRYEKPGTTRKIRWQIYPQPYATESSSNGRDVVARPENAWPVAPAGFKVELYASGLENPRWCARLRTATFFLRKGIPDAFRVFRGMTCERQARADGNFRRRTETSVWYRFLSAGSRSAMDLHRQRKRSGSFSLSQWRFEGERAIAAHRRPAGRRAQHAGGRIFAGRQENVCRGRLGIERGRSGHAAAKKRIAPTFWSAIRRIASCRCMPTAFAMRAAGSR